MLRVFFYSVSLFFLTACNSLTFKHIKSEEKCACKENSYWYKNTCWKNFQDESISITEIDSIVKTHIVIADSSTMLIGDSVYKLNMLMPFPNGNSILFFAEFEKDTSNYSLFTQIPKKSFKSDKSFNFGLFNGSLMSNTLDTVLQGKALITFKELSDNEIKGVGKILLSGKSDSLNISFSGNEAISGMGNSKLSIEKDSAYLSGDLGTITYFQIKNLIQQHPEIKTLVLTDISGSINDAVNMHTGRIVREAGLNTYVPSNGSIASGGVDLFCAGVQRTISNGAKVGVHSWCCINDLTASELPKTHPAHKAQLDYFTLLMGPIDGPAFYFYTLTAASFEDVHWMSNNEMIEYKIITNTIK